MSYSGNTKLFDEDGKIDSTLLPPSISGKSAYEIYVDTQTETHGAILSEVAWLASLKGTDGITPIKGVDYFDGLSGSPGLPGYTPVKGVDYNDGIPGSPGSPGYTPIKGVDYFDGVPGAPSTVPGPPGPPGNDGVTQDISGLQPKETGKGLYPDVDGIKLAGIATGATVGADWNVNISNKPTIPDIGFKCGIATKNINDGSTTQNIAHGLGRIPKIVRVSAHAAYAAALSEICQGAYDGTNHSGICLCSAEGTTTALIDNIYNSTAAELGFTAATGTNPYTGANRQTGVITCDATNIIITWTKAGTVASNTVNILWEVT